jgi:TonB-linked SusC/RagA family outer membrane protein
MKQKIYTLFIGLALFFVCTTALAQSVSGTVKAEEDGLGIPGVSVVVKGTARATLTDLDGNFTIEAPPQSLLVFSLVGYKMQEIAVGNQTTFDVTMEGGNIKMDEMVVTALGTSKEKRQLGYSSQEVKGDELQSTQRTNVLESLQGRVAGLTINTTSGAPGASSQIILRQPTSFSQDNQPLFVIDGVPVNNSALNQNTLVTDGANRSADYTNRIGDINPDDIESINVLKGPEAAALYGFYGANGAIIITTKKGKSGPGKVNYSFNYGIQDLTRFPEVQKIYGRGEFGIFDTRYRRHFGPKYAEGTQLYDNFGEFFQRGSNNQHNLSFEGGNEKTTYRFSAALADNLGVVPGTNYRRMNIGARGSTQITKDLQISTGLNFVNSSNFKSSKGTNSIFQTILVWPADDQMSNYLDPLGNRRTIAAGAFDTEFENPYYDAIQNRASDKGNRFYGNLSLVYNPTKWLNFTMNSGYDNNTTNGNTFTHPASQRGGSGGGIGGQVEEYTDNYGVFNSTFSGRVQNDFGKLNASLRVGAALDEQRRTTISSIGQRLQVPELNTINNAFPSTIRSANIINVRRSAGFFGEVTLDYDRFLTLNASLRNDITSTLPIQNRSFWYPSANVSFVFSELLKLKWLDFGKLRVAMAGSGKDISAYGIRSEMRPQQTTGGGYLFGFTGNAPDLKPEIIRSYSTGLELSFFKDRVGLELTYYTQNTKDLLFRNFRISYGTGFILKNLNLGELTTNGIEAVLKVVPVKTKDFQWTTIANFTKGNGTFSGLPSNIPEFYNSDTWLFGNARASIFQDNLIKQYGYEGSSNISLIGGYRYFRNNKGDVLVNPQSGQPLVDANFYPIGDRNPDFILGLVNKFRYKSIDLSFTMDIRKGGDIFNGTAQFLWQFGLHPKQIDREKAIVFNGVLRDGNENSENPTRNNIEIIPSFYGGGAYRASEESFIEKDINWLRLRDARISYRLPTTLIKKWKFMREASVYVSGTDLLLISNYTGADPNVNGLTAGVPGLNATGFDFGVLPSPRAFNFGVSIGF